MLKLIKQVGVFSALFLMSTASNALVYNFTYTGLFTALDSTGQFLVNTDAATNAYDGHRTDIAGLLSFDDVSGAGSFTVNPFDFFGGTNPFTLQGTANMQVIGDGFGGTGTNMLADMVFDWDGFTNVPIAFNIDMAGLEDAISIGMLVGDQISGDQLISGATSTTIASALPASDNTDPAGPLSAYPIGPAPLAMTTFNVSPGGLPLIFDTTIDATNGDTGIGGSPMVSGPFQGSNFNFDIGDAGTMVLQSIEPSPSTVPVPAAFWLFGSGLLGLIGVARRKVCT